MAAPLILLPAPRRVQPTAGQFALSDPLLIALDAPQPQLLRPAAARIQKALAKVGLAAEQTASPAARAAVTLRVAPELAPHPEGYHLYISSDGVVIEGHDPAGVFYGACTLAQVIDQSGGALPGLDVTDWPDLPNRGVMLDISRDRVYRMDYLLDLVDRLAGWKINQVQLYTEHTFAYQNHRTVWQAASPMTGEEILALDAYCRERFIELVPNQNSFGHMERWLIHPGYGEMAETHDEFETPWGHKMKGPFSLAPEHPGSLPLIRSLYDELLPHFTSKMFNVGCDETLDVGQGVSKAICEQRGSGRVYLDYLLKVYADVSRRGYTMQFWGDIINLHPELVPELPRDVIALEWGYEADHPFDENGRRFADSGVPFYVCPGTSTWCSIAGRTDNAVGNLRAAAEGARKHGAIGYLNTDWGDRGHWQAPPASLLGLALGAAYSWSLDASLGLDIPAAVSRFAFEDPTGVMGRAAYDLGNVYKVPSLAIRNGSALFWSLQLPLGVSLRGDMPTAESLRASIEAVDAVLAPISGEQMARPDAALIRREFALMGRMLQHGAKRALLSIEGKQEAACRALAADMSEITAEYRELWLARSRPGGLSDSVGRLERAAQDYAC